MSHLHVTHKTLHIQTLHIYLTHNLLLRIVCGCVGLCVCVRKCVRAGDRDYFICKKGTSSSNVKENSCEFSLAYVFYFYDSLLQMSSLFTCQFFLYMSSFFTLSSLSHLMIKFFCVHVCVCMCVRVGDRNYFLWGGYDQQAP